MDRERLFKALAEVVLYADLEELPWAALKKHYGEIWVNNVASLDDPEIGPRMSVLEMLLRFADGHALPKNVGLKDEMAILYEELGLNPEDIGEYPP